MEGVYVLRALDIPILRDRRPHNTIARDPEVRDLGRQARCGVVRAHARLDQLHSGLPVPLARRGQLAGAWGNGDGEGLCSAGHSSEHERAPEEADKVVLFRDKTPGASVHSLACILRSTGP